VGGLSRPRYGGSSWASRRSASPRASPHRTDAISGCNKTLKAETAQPPAATLAHQQQRFDHFRREFNHERPHETQGQTAPAKHYCASPRGYPARSDDPVYPSDYEVPRVRSTSEIKWAGEKIFLSAPLIGEVVGVKETDNGDGETYFGPVALAIIDGLA
jgi:putative transposase